MAKNLSLNMDKKCDSSGEVCLTNGSTESEPAASNQEESCNNHVEVIEAKLAEEASPSDQEKAKITRALKFEERLKTIIQPVNPSSSEDNSIESAAGDDDDVAAYLSNAEKLRSLCKRGNAEELDKFLSGANIPNEVNLNITTEDGWTCLHDIITHDCQFTDVARVLLKHGADVNTRDINGDTPLHSSLLYHNTDNISLLLQNRADLEAVNSSGRRPIHIANDGDSLQLLLDYGASPDAQDAVGNTPLHYAVLAKDGERVNILIALGCDVQPRNRSGSSPLHLANDFLMAKILLGSKADPNCVDNRGNSPLHLAVRGRHKDIARLILDNKGDPHLLNNNAKSPFNLAKDKEMKRILLGKDSRSIAKNTKRVPVIIPIVKNDLIPADPVITSPSILKSEKMDERRQPTGRRLRFSDVVDYSGVEEVEGATPSKRIKVPPVYTDAQFSSDDD